MAKGIKSVKVKAVSSEKNWIEVKVKKPPENQVVQTKIDDTNGVRNEQKLIYSNNLLVVS